MRFFLFATWALGALPPLAAALLPGAACGARRVALTLLVTTLGLGAAAAVSLQPARQALLRNVLAATPVRMLLALAVLLVAFLAVTADFLAGWILAAAGYAAVLLLAATARSEAAFLRVVRWKLRALLAALALAAIGETTMRLPAVSRTLMPPAYVTDQQRRHGRHYDADAHVALGDTIVRSRHLVDGALAPAAAGCRTVLVVGDSFTWGEHVFSTDDIWPYVAERALRDRGICARVVNLAQGGYTTVNEVEAVLRYGMPLQPDLIVVQYLVNDPLPSGPNFQRVTGAWLLNPAPPLAIVSGLHRALDAHSYLYSWLNEAWRRAHAAWTGRQDRSFADLHAPNFPGWIATTNAIRQLADAARAQNIPVLAVIAPVFTPELSTIERSGYLYAPQHQQVSDAFGRQGIPCLDLLGIFAAVHPDPRAWWILPTDGHPSREAHRLMGDTIAAEIARRWPPADAP